MIATAPTVRKNTGADRGFGANRATRVMRAATSSRCSLGSNRSAIGDVPREATIAAQRYGSVSIPKCFVTAATSAPLNEILVEAQSNSGLLEQESLLADVVAKAVPLR